MTVDPGTRSRRALLVGGMGSLAAVALAALGRPGRVDAANGDTMKVGQGHSASSLTAVNSTSNGFKGKATGAGGSGIIGQSTSVTGFGVNGVNPNGGIGVRGAASNNGIGVYGNAARGVVGETSAPNGIGVVARNNATTGTGNGLRALAFAPAADAIYAENSGNGGGGAAIHATSSTETTVRILNVLGDNTTTGLDVSAAGVGVDATGRIGVAGHAAQGSSGFAAGVRGTANNAEHQGGSFENLDPNGFSPRVTGRLRLEGAAGKPTINSGSDSVIVTPGAPVKNSSLVIATMQSGAGPGVTVHRVVVGASTFQIFLTGNAAQQCEVGWMMLN